MDRYGSAILAGTGHAREAGITTIRIGTEKIIATARVIVSALIFSAMFLDRTQLSIRVELAYVVISSYFILSVLLLCIVCFSTPSLRNRRLDRLFLHIIDIGFITSLVYFTRGTTPSVFGFFVFLVIVSCVRWNWKGTLATTLAVVSAYLLVTALSTNIPVFGETDVDGIVVRIGYLSVVATILGYVSYAQERAAETLLFASEWPIAVNPVEALPAFLRHAADILGSNGAVLLWVSEDEAFADLVFWRNDRVVRRKWPRDLVEARCNLEPPTQVFHWRSRSRKTLVISGQPRQLPNPPFPVKLLRLCGAENVLGILFRAQNGYGCLFSAREAVGGDDLVITHIIADRFRAWADQVCLYRRVEEARAREQLFGLASDIHDTALQTIAGTSFELQSIAPAIAPTYPHIAERLSRLVQALTREQDALRRKLHETSAASLFNSIEEVPLKRRLEELANSVEARWGLWTEWRVDPPRAVVNRRIDHQLTHIVLEAAANAKKHAHASRLSIGIELEAERIHLVISNDRHNVQAVAGAEPVSFDPRMLRRRVEHLGGSIAVHAEANDTELRITIPLRAAQQWQT